VEVVGPHVCRFQEQTSGLLQPPVQVAETSIEQITLK